MKRTVLLIVGLIALAGCEMVDFGFGGEARGGRTTPGSSGRQRDTSSVAGEPARADTIIWTCAVKVPDGYDWARDTSAGHFSGELLLYRNSEPELILPVGGQAPIGPDPGSHHLAGGHLYTEYYTEGQTIVLREGKPFLQLDGACFLKGLLPGKDGSALTLFCSLSDGGLLLLRDSELLLKINGGSAPGGLGEGRPSLYEDEGHYCFEYRNGDSFYSVRDGIISAVMPPEAGLTVEDYRWFAGKQTLLLRKGQFHYLYEDGEKRKVTQMSMDMQLIEAGGVMYACGVSSHRGKSIIYAKDLPAFTDLFFTGSDPWLLCSEDGLFCVQGRDPLIIGRPARSAGGTTAEFSDRDLMVFSAECVSVCGRDLLLGASVPGSHPVLMRGGRVVGEFPFEGYVTAVGVEIIPPS